MHTVLVHHMDNEVSNEGSFETRVEALEYAVSKAQTIHSNEFVSTLGYAIRGLIVVPNKY